MSSRNKVADWACYLLVDFLVIFILGDVYHIESRLNLNLA